MFFEVEIPNSETQTNRTLQVDAPSWRAALMTAMAQTESPITSLENFAIDLGRDAVSVTDPVSRRVVRIAQLEENHIRKSQVMKAITGTHLIANEAAAAEETAAAKPKGRAAAKAAAKAAKAAKAVAEAPKKPSVDRSIGGSTSQRLRFKDKATGAFRSIVSTEIQKQALESGNEGGRVLADTVAPARPVNESVITEIPDALSREMELASISETALEDVFLEITQIFEPDYAMEDAIDFVLDLAFKYVPSASGGLLFASDSADHLYFAAARGEGKKKLLKSELSITKGIPATSLKDGVAIATSPGNDGGRHTDEIADKSGIEVQSICTAPIQAGPRAFGVLMLVNRKERSFFSQYDANIVTYIGTQMGRFIQDQLDAAPLE